MPRAFNKGWAVVIAITLVSGVAWATGNTIAASAKTQKVSFGSTDMLASGLDATDVCVTITNRSEKAGLIQVTLTDEEQSTSMMQVPKEKALALCGDNTETVEVECLGPKSCYYRWSVDKF